jgi:NTE family protein
MSSTAFVLSGGGSLGANQVGMIRALYEHRIAPDLIVATSIGALNAAFIASRPKTVETTRDLAALWRQNAERRLFKLSPVSFALDLVGRRAYFVTREGMSQVLDELLEFDLLEEAPTPIHVVATDIVTGEDLRLSSGDARTAALASAAVPGILAPIEWEGRVLVDGGVADNTPVRHAVELGAGRVYVLPTGTPSALRERPKGVIGMAGHWLGLMHEAQSLLDIESLRERTELIVLPPPFPQAVSPADFSHSDELIERSYRAATAWLDSPRGGAGRLPEAMNTRLRDRPRKPAPPAARATSSAAGERTAFAFLGGASLGAVQAGALRALYEDGIKPDLIVGCSIGAFNASLIASRPMTVNTALWLADVWRRLTRRDLYPFNPVRLAAGFGGASDGALSQSGLARLLRRHLELDRLEDSPVPVHLMAADLLNGKEERLSAGDAATAVRASMAYPAIFAPVPWGERSLIGGGMIENTITHALELGATTVYVLPTGYSCASDEVPTGSTEMLIQSGEISHRRQLRAELESLRDQARLIIMPPPCPLLVRQSDFNHASELLERSYGSATRLLDDPTDQAGRIPRGLTRHSHP